MESRLPYFYIKENFENNRGIRIYTSDDIPRNIKMLNERFYKLPRDFILEIETTENFVFPDLMMNVYPLISETFRDVLLLFNIEIFTKRVILIDKNSGKIKEYHLLYSENLVDSNFNKSLRAVIDEDGKLKFRVSLDFAESFIRRGINGIEFIEAED